MSRTAARPAGRGFVSSDRRSSARRHPSLRLFAFYLANGTLDLDLLDGIDYRPTVFSSGSSLEQVFAIYTNVLQVGADDLVLNDGDAQYRVAQWIRVCCDPSYRVEPPFEAWETELHV